MPGLRQDEVPRSRGRRWRVPPPPTYHYGRFDGCEILDEIAGQLGLTLFQRARDVLLWSQTPPELRLNLFVSSRRTTFGIPASTDRPLADALGVLAGLVAQPCSATREAVAEACAGVSDWASRKACLFTALVYARAATFVMPENPMLAVAAGRVARKLADYDRAISWFTRAIALARTSGRASAYVTAVISWATLETQRGDLHSAKNILLRGWRMAHRHKLRHLAARTRHDLLQVTFERREFDEAEAHAWSAFELYGPRAKSFFALVHDWAFLWILQGYFPAALAVLEPLRPHLTIPSERILLLSSIARARGGLGDADGYSEAAEGVLRLLDVTAENGAGALDNIAEGAYSLRRFEDAKDLSMRAVHLAFARNEAQMAFEASARLQRIAERQPPEISRPLPQGSSVPIAIEKILERLKR